MGRFIIVSGYIGILAMVIGAFLIFVNHTILTYAIAKEVAGISLVVWGAVTLVSCSYSIHKWYKR